MSQLSQLGAGSCFLERGALKSMTLSAGSFHRFPVTGQIGGLFSGSLRQAVEICSQVVTEIRELTTNEQLGAAYEVMSQLRPHLSLKKFLAQVHYQRENENYHLVGLFQDAALMCLGGFRTMTNLACGKFVYVDDLVSDHSSRSSGHGAKLLDWIANYGRLNGCVQLHLDSGVQRHGAHRFYLRERMDIVYYHFKRDLE